MSNRKESPAPPVLGEACADAPTGPAPEYFEVREMARRLKVSTSTVWRMVKIGTLVGPRHFSTTVVRWSEEDYRRWYDQGSGR